MNKPLLLLTSSAFVLASVMPALPPAAADDGIAAGAYWTLSFGGDVLEESPEFGFHVGRQVEGQPAIVPDSSLGGNGYVPMQSFMDLKFNDQGPVALNFAGVNTLPLVGPTLGFHGDPDDPMATTEHALMIGGAGVGAALIICALAGCFGSSDEDGGDDGGTGNDSIDGGSN